MLLGIEKRIRASLATEQLTWAGGWAYSLVFRVLEEDDDDHLAGLTGSCVNVGRGVR